MSPWKALTASQTVFATYQINFLPSRTFLAVP